MPNPRTKLCTKALYAGSDHGSFSAVSLFGRLTHTMRVTAPAPSLVTQSPNTWNTKICLWNVPMYAFALTGIRCPVPTIKMPRRLA